MVRGCMCFVLGRGVSVVDEYSAMREANVRLNHLAALLLHAADAVTPPFTHLLLTRGAQVRSEAPDDSLLGYKGGCICVGKGVMSGVIRRSWMSVVWC